MLLCLGLLILSLMFSAVLAVEKTDGIPSDQPSLTSTENVVSSMSKVTFGRQRVELSATRGVEKVRYFTLTSPKRLVVDLYGVLPGSHARSFALDNGFKGLRVGPYQDKTRFVFDVAGAEFPIFKVDTENRRVAVTWGPSDAIIKQARSEAKTADFSRVTAIDFTSESGRSQFLIRTDTPVTATSPEKIDNKIQFTLKDATIPRALRRVFDTLAFPSAIYSVTPYLINVADKPQVRFSVILKGDVNYELKKVAAGYLFIVDDGGYAVAAPRESEILPVSVSGAATRRGAAQAREGSTGPAASEDLPAMQRSAIEQIGSDDTIYRGERITLIFDSADVRNILQLIAEVSDLNIIATDEVKGNVTLRLIDVPWDQALSLVLDITGLGMLQEGNVVRVLPKNQIRSMKEAELTAVRSQEKLEPLSTEVITVSYADLGSVAGPAKEILSERGSITEDSRNKLLIITDVTARIEKAKELIAILDTPERQVMIEARIVQVNSNYSRDLGVNWFLEGQDALVNPSVQGVGGAGGGFLVDTIDEDLGSLIATPGLATQMRIGRTLIDELVLTFQLSALESDGKGKIISTPRVTTLNGEQAIISQGTSIPYQTSGADGPKTEFVNAELKLEVTPVINPDNSIILEILATNDSPSLTAGATAPSIDTRKAETKVLVRDGETTVIGGIFVENVQETEEGVPWLMHIPAVGHLFKSSKKQTVKDELLVFITPRIMREE